MKTVTKEQLLKTFPPTKAIVNLSQFQLSEGWLTNGFFAVKKQLEPKSSKQYRFRETKIRVMSVVEKTTKKLNEYQEADILNYIELQVWSRSKSFLIKLKSEDYEVWVNPQYISYLYQGMEFFKDLKIMIGKDINDPIAFVVDGEIQGLVIGFRNQE